MVVLASGYYIDPFKIYQGLTQGDPISSKIFNVVVEAVIRRGGGGCGPRRISLCSAVDVLLFIFRKWTPCVNTDGMDQVGLWICLNMKS